MLSIISHLCHNNENVNMTSRMLKQSNNFKLSHQCSPSQRKVLLKWANPALIHAICDYIANIIYEKVPITTKQKRDLAKKKKVSRTLSSSRTKTPRKKKLLIQHGGGILKTILGTVLNAITSFWVSLLAKQFLVIESDTYDMMTKHSAKSYQPEKNKLIKSEEEMQSVWSTIVLPHEKVKQFTEELNKFRSLLKTMSEPVKVQI